MLSHFRRGTCKFLNKAIHAQSKGAIGVVIIDYDNKSGLAYPPILGGEKEWNYIPIVTVSQENGLDILTRMSPQSSFTMSFSTTWRFSREVLQKYDQYIHDMEDANALWDIHLACKKLRQLKPSDVSFMDIESFALSSFIELVEVAGDRRLPTAHTSLRDLYISRGTKQAFELSTKIAVYHFDYQLTLGVQFLLMKEPRIASICFHNCRSILESGHVASDEDSRRLVNMYTGIGFLGSGKYREAKDIFSSLLDKYPLDATFTFLLFVSTFCLNEPLESAVTVFSDKLNYEVPAVTTKEANVYIASISNFLTSLFTSSYSFRNLVDDLGVEGVYLGPFGDLMLRLGIFSAGKSIVDNVSRADCSPGTLLLYSCLFL
jgi:hypothetical protein